MVTSHSSFIQLASVSHSILISIPQLVWPLRGRLWDSRRLTLNELAPFLNVDEARPPLNPLVLRGAGTDASRIREEE